MPRDAVFEALMVMSKNLCLDVVTLMPSNFDAKGDLEGGANFDVGEDSFVVRVLRV